MDFKQIQELIKMVNKSNIGELTVEQKDFRVTIKQKEEKSQVIAAVPQNIPVYQQAPQHLPAQPAPVSSMGKKSGI